MIREVYFFNGICCLSAPKGTFLCDLERHAGVVRGGKWRIREGCDSVYIDPDNSNNFWWELERIEP